MWFKIKDWLRYKLAIRIIKKKLRELEQERKDKESKYLAYTLKK